MKATLIIIRGIGGVCAIWIFYMLVSAQMQIHDQMKDFLPSSVSWPSPAVQQALVATLPFGFLGLLLLLPYSRMSKGIRCGVMVLIAILGGWFLNYFYGGYFFSSHSVVSAIPMRVWVGSFLFIGVFASQIFAIFMQNRNAEDAANRALRGG